MEFQFDINLRRMALFAYGLSFWKTKEMQHKLRQFHYPYGRRGKIQFLHQLADEVVEKIDPTSLPAPLYSELIEIVRMIPFKIHDWFNFIRRKRIFRDQSRRQIYDKFCAEIYWTNYGTIDVAKILKCSWVNVRKEDLIKVYVMACCFCVEDLIVELWDEIVRKKIKFLPDKNLYDRSGFHLVAYWNKLRENKLEDFINNCILRHGIYNSARSVEVNMLRLSILKGYAGSAKYFWNKLTEQERNKNIKSFMTTAILGENQKFIWQVQGYSRDQYVDMTFFFMNFINEELTKKIFLTQVTGRFGEKENINIKIETIIGFCLDIWPWQKFFKLLLNKLGNLFNQYTYKMIVNAILCHSYRQKNPHYQNLIQLVWNRMPSECKISVLDQYNLNSFLEMGNISCMKFIFFDESLIFKQSDIIKRLHSQLHSMMRQNKSDVLRKFFHEILVPQNLAEDLKEILKLLYDGLMDCDLNLVYKSVNCLSKEEGETLKSIIDPEIFCYYFIIKNQFDLADQFLSWRFDEENVIKFKNEFEKNGFVMYQIYHLWNVPKENVELAKQNCDKFLHWLLCESKNVISFKLKKMSYILFESSDLEYHPDNLEDFLKWIHFDDDDFRNFKKKFLERDLPGIIEHFIKIGDWETVDKFCKWTFSSDEEMLSFLKKMLLSRQGITSIQCYISKYSNPDLFNPKSEKELRHNFLSFIRFLIKPLKNFDDLKEKLSGWKKSSKKIYEQIDSNEDTTDKSHSSYITDDPDDEFYVYCKVYCEVKNYELFLKLLNEVENDSDSEAA